MHGFRLSKDMLPINRNINKIVTDENGQRRKESTVKEYEIAGKYFSELDEYLQEKLRDTEISVIMLIDATDEEIEEQFFRLNNGTALTKDQKTRVMLKLLPFLFPNGFPYPLGLGNGAFDTFTIPANTCFLSEPSSFR